MTLSISDIINRGKLKLYPLFSTMPERIIQAGERLGFIHILLLSTIFITLSVILHDGGFLHPELEVYIPYYLSDTPLLNILYDSRVTDMGNFQARELSYLVDYVDSKFFELSVNLKHPHFLSLSNYVFSFIIGILLWQFCVKDLELGKLNSTLLILVFWTSTYSILDGILFRSAKIGVTLTSACIFVILYRTLKRDKQIEGYKLPASIWLSCFGLSWAMTLFDKQGVYLDITIIIFLFVWMISSFSRNIVFLISAFIASLSLCIIYTNIIAPSLTFYLNHYYPDVRYQDLFTRGNLAHFIQYFGQYMYSGEFLFFETIRYTIGNFSYPLVSYPVILLIIFFVFVGIKEIVKNKLKPNPKVLVIAGMLLVYFVFIPLMNSLMILRHPPLFYIRTVYYLLPASTLMLFAFALILSYLKKARIIPAFVIVVFLAIAVVGNLVVLPQNNRGARNEFYEKSALLIKSLRHINDISGKNYRVPKAIEQDLVYLFFKSRVK